MIAAKNVGARKPSWLANPRVSSRSIIRWVNMCLRGELDGTHWTRDLNFLTSRQLALVRFHLRMEIATKYHWKHLQFRSWLALDIRNRTLAVAPFCKNNLKQKVDVSMGDTKVDIVCSRWSLDNLKQYAMMWHILFKLEYLFSKSSMMQGWKVEAATRIFLREDHCLNAGRHWAASVLPILEIQSHSTTSQHYVIGI